MPLNPDDLEDDEDLNPNIGLENNESDDSSDDDDNEDDSPNPSVTGYDPESIARLAAQTALQVHSQNQQPRQYTQDELDAQLGRFKVTPEHMAALFDPEAKPEARQALFQQMLDAAAQYAVRGANVLNQSAIAPLQQQIEQANAYNREQKIKTLTGHVAKRFPTLAGKNAVIKEAIHTLIASGYQAPNGSATAVQKEIAKLAAAKIRTIDPSFSLKGNAQRQAGSFGSRNSSGQGRTLNVGQGPKSFLDALS